MQYCFFGLFVALSLVHLYDSWRDDARKRARTKPFLLLLLLLFYLAAAKERSLPLVLALLFSWLGDVLLIPRGHRWFALGGISFMLAHLLFIQVYVNHIRWEGLPWGLVIPVTALYFLAALRVILAVREKTPRFMIFPMYFYLLANSAMNSFAFMQLLSLRSPGALTAYLGAILFYLSDCTLFLVRYHKKKNLVYHRHFTVMLTYLLGETFITVGVLWIGGAV